jgi:hypothetical protein
LRLDCVAAKVATATFFLRSAAARSLVILR